MSLEAIRPRTTPQVIELVQASFDVAAWAAHEGAAGADPACRREPCSSEGGGSRVSIRFENLILRDGMILQNLDLRQTARTKGGPRRGRALRFDKAIPAAARTGVNLRAMILHRSTRGKGNAPSRMLDPEPWHVPSCYSDRGAFTIVRGTRPGAGERAWDAAVQEFAEGAIRRPMTLHRKRERAAPKIARALEQGGGRLLCEVPGCRFGVFAVHGEAGRGHAHVHHKLPRANPPPARARVSRADLAIVGASCHAMIHRRGGGRRDMAELIPSEAR